MVCFAVWLWTVYDAWLEEYFKAPAALLLVSMAGVEWYFSRLVANCFSPEQPMRKAWRLIAWSAGFDIAGAICIQILSVDSVINPLRAFPWWDGGAIRRFGLVLGGPCRFALLAVGLGWALRAYRRSGLLARFHWIDRMVLPGMGLYMVFEAQDVAAAIHRGWKPSPAMIIGWATDPLLWLLLAGALLLYRSARQMGAGWIGRCWQALSAGVFLVSLGDIAIWAASRGLLPWPWSALGWYVWLPAAGAFALAPVYQFEAIHLAGSQPEKSFGAAGE
jgi:hypothetical protein